MAPQATKRPVTFDSDTGAYARIEESGILVIDATGKVEAWFEIRRYADAVLQKLRRYADTMLDAEHQKLGILVNDSGWFGVPCSTQILDRVTKLPPERKLDRVTADGKIAALHKALGYLPPPEKDDVAEREELLAPYKAIIIAALAGDDKVVFHDAGASLVFPSQEKLARLRGALTAAGYNENLSIALTSDSFGAIAGYSLDLSRELAASLQADPACVLKLEPEGGKLPRQAALDTVIKFLPLPVVYDKLTSNPDITLVFHTAGAALVGTDPMETRELPDLLKKLPNEKGYPTHTDSRLFFAIAITPQTANILAASGKATRVVGKGNLQTFQETLAPMHLQFAVSQLQKMVKSGMIVIGFNDGALVLSPQHETAFTGIIKDLDRAGYPITFPVGKIGTMSHMTIGAELSTAFLASPENSKTPAPNYPVRRDDAIDIVTAIACGLNPTTLRKIYDYGYILRRPTELQLIMPIDQTDDIALTSALNPVSPVKAFARTPGAGSENGLVLSLAWLKPLTTLLSTLGDKQVIFDSMRPKPAAALPSKPRIVTAPAITAQLALNYIVENGAFFPLDNGRMSLVFRDDPQAIEVLKYIRIASGHKEADPLFKGSTPPGERVPISTMRTPRVGGKAGPAYIEMGVSVNFPGAIKADSRFQAMGKELHVTPLLSPADKMSSIQEHFSTRTPPGRT